MNHPNKEELVELLYGEVAGDRLAEMNAHLEECAQCRAQVSKWRAVKTDLAAWKVAAAPTRRNSWGTTLKWAAAAVFMLAVGFGFGRLATPRVDAGQLRAEIETRMQAEFQKQLQLARTADRKEVIAMLRDVEEQRLSDYTQLRKDLETVAVVADEKLTTTQRAFSQLNLVAQTESALQPPQ